MNLYERIKAANKLTTELEDIDRIINGLTEGQLVTIVSKDRSRGTKVYELESLSTKGHAEAQALLAMSIEFFKQQLIKYYELRKEGIVKDIDNLIEG